MFSSDSGVLVVEVMAGVVVVVVVVGEGLGGAKSLEWEAFVVAELQVCNSTPVRWLPPSG